MRKLLLLLSFCFAVAAAAHAQGIRSLPPKGDRGTLGANQPLPQVQIGSNVLRLAPGAIIYDQNNRTVVHSQLPTDVDVFYTKDQNGDVQRMYILTDQEKARLDQSRTR
jgi:hypothetical protein